MTPFKMERFTNSAITEEIIATAAKFFTSNYGVWGPLASENIGPFAKQGARVKMSPKKLQEQILPANANNIYIRVTMNDELAGNVFGTRWEYEGRSILWITQLCASSKQRNQGIAKKMLASLHVSDTEVGILSSHPFAILAVLSVFGCGSENVDLEMTREHAKEIMASCPVNYVRQAKLRGKLFEEREDVEDQMISCADTGFWVDHQEPLDALQTLRDKGVKWPLGGLPDGHEFLVIVKGTSSAL